MKFHEGYTRVVAVGECGVGNESVGTVWLETKVFSKDTPISSVIEWAKTQGVGGRLILTVDQPSQCVIAGEVSQ